MTGACVLPCVLHDEHDCKSCQVVSQSEMIRDLCCLIRRNIGYMTQEDQNILFAAERMIE